MSEFNFFKHDVKINNQRIAKAEAERRRQQEIKEITQAIFNNANVYASTIAPFKSAGAADNEINLSYENANLQIVVESKIRFAVNKTFTNSTVPPGGPGQMVNQEEMMTRVVDFIRNRG